MNLDLHWPFPCHCHSYRSRYTSRLLSSVRLHTCRGVFLDRQYAAFPSSSGALRSHPNRTRTSNLAANADFENLLNGDRPHHRSLPMSSRLFIAVSDCCAGRRVEPELVTRRHIKMESPKATHIPISSRMFSLCLIAVPDDRWSQGMKQDGILGSNRQR